MPFVPADPETYLALKGVTPIAQPRVPVATDPGPVPEGACPDSWPFWAARLSAAARGEDCLSRFPGSVLPGPGANRSVTGPVALSHARFLWAVSRPGGLIRAETPGFERRALPRLDRWDWPGVPEPELEEVVLGPSDVPPATERERAAYAAVRPTREGIRQVSRLWCPGGGAPDPSEELLSRVRVRFPEAARRPAAFAWELEEYLAHRDDARAWNGLGHGVWNGFWLEVGLAPIDAIVPTELAVVERVAAELEALLARGFAPVVVNEHGCDTDGTHRLLAAWLHNLCRSLDHALVARPDRVGAHLRERARAWASGASAPGVAPRPLIVREGLRFLGVAERDPVLRARLAEVCCLARGTPAVCRLPTTFLRERSWETVVKRDYDLSARTARVDPRVYAALAAEPCLVLPARGPYHRTDRALLPWFDVLAINRETRERG